MFKRIFAAALLMGLMVSGGVRVQAQESAPQSTAKSGEQSTPEAQVPEKKAEAQDENEAYRHSATVTKLGAMLGMQPETAATAFTLFNLAVLLGAVGFFLMKALPKAFRDRSTAIQKHLVDARTATEEATARLNSVEARLSKLDEQIAGMRTQAEADSARDEQRIKANIEEEKVKILAAAEQEIATATTQAQRQIQQYAAELAIEHAARKLIVSAETDRLLVESFAHRLGGDKGGQN
jgi:F-type H+-transporting ATPase subunit b